MASKGTLKVRIVGDASHFEKTLKSTSSGIKKWGKRAGLAVAAVGAAGVAAGVHLAKAAVNIEETQRKVATVFEDSVGVIKEWSRESARAMGLTTNELEGLAANFADLLKPMGFTAAQASSMSMDVVGLAGALAEWSNGQVDAAGAAEILSKAMLGERESLKTLGISIMEADVAQRLLEKGQKDLTGTALQQAKAIATQELIFEKSTDAQAAYASGSDTLRRKQAELSATFRELRDRIADRLIPPLVELANRVTPAVIEAADRISAAFDSRGVGGAFSEAGRIIQEWWDVTVYPFLMNTVVPAAVDAGLAIGRGLGTAILQGVQDSWRQAPDLIGWLAGQFDELNFLADSAGRIVDLAPPASPTLNLPSSRNVPSSGRSGPTVNTGPSSGRTGGFQEFDSGGVVAGRRGSPQLVLAHAGETILPTHKRGGMGTNVTVNINGFDGDARRLAEQVVRAIRDADRRGMRTSLAAS